jgi:hypothetical protein
MQRLLRLPLPTLLYNVYQGFFHWGKVAEAWGWPHSRAGVKNCGAVGLILDEFTGLQFTYSLQPHYRPGIYSASDTNGYQEFSWDVKRGWRARFPASPSHYLENVVASTSHNLMGPQGLLQELVLLCKLRFSRRCLWRMPSSGMWRRVTLVRTDVSRNVSPPISGWQESAG